LFVIHKKHNTMKHLFFILLSICIAGSGSAQKLEFGLQAGVNYNFSGDLKELNVLDTSVDDIYHGAKSVTGYHGGVWARLNFSDIFLKSELLYTKYENDFSGPFNYNLTTKKIDMPIVLGMRILGPLYVFAGPDFQYILAADFSVANTDVTYDDFTTGLHLGFGLEFDRFALDLRWEKGLAESDASIINSDIINENFTLDNRPNQLVLSLHYTLTKPK